VLTNTITYLIDQLGSSGNLKFVEMFLIIAANEGISAGELTGRMSPLSGSPLSPLQQQLGSLGRRKRGPDLIEWFTKEEEPNKRLFRLTPLGKEIVANIFYSVEPDADRVNQRVREKLTDLIETME